MFKFLISVAIICSASAAHAADCKSIQDATARLACFDAAPKVVPKQVAKKPPGDEFGDAKSAMSRKLVDPESARFTDLFKVSTPDEGTVVCGMVNSKNQMGGYTGARGFIYQTNARLATLMLSGASDPEYKGQNAASYCVYCATDPRGDRAFSSYCPSLIKSYRAG